MGKCLVKCRENQGEFDNLKDKGSFTKEREWSVNRTGLWALGLETWRSFVTLKNDSSGREDFSGKVEIWLEWTQERDEKRESGNWETHSS